MSRLISTLPTMLPSEVAQAREVLDLTHEQLAADLAVTEAEVRGWQDGSVRVPKRYARRLQWQLALHEHAERMEASGLPECSWVQKWEEERGLPTTAERFKEFEDHSADCAVCQARTAFADTLPPLPPYPAEGAARVLVYVGDRIEQLPPRARAATVGALLFLAYTLLKGGIMLLTNPSSDMVVTFGIALVVSPTIGAVCGFAFGWIRSLWRRRAQVTA